MFKNNYLKKLAFDNIRKQKKLYKFIFLALTLAFFLTTVSSILFLSFENIGHIERVQRYGRWSSAIENITNEQMEIMEHNPYVQEKGMVYQLGEFSFDNKQTKSVMSIDGEAQNLLALQLKEGRMPIAQNEIAIEDDELTALGIPQQLNQTLTFVRDGKQVQYKLVGIIKNYTHSYLLPLGSLVVCGETSSQRIGLYNGEDNASLFNQMKEDRLIEGSYLNTFTYTLISYRESSQSYVDRSISIEMQSFITLIGFSGVLGTMVSSMKKRENYLILMRAIGATKKQVQKLIVYEGVLLGIISMTIGIIIGVMMSFLVLFGYHCYMNGPLIFVFNQTCLIQLLMITIACFVAIILPSMNIYTIPLVGKLTQKVHGKKVRKRRKVSVFRLSLREISNHKVMSFLMILLLICEIIAGYHGTTTIANYYSNMQEFVEQKDFDYVLTQDDWGEKPKYISSQDIQSITSIPGISSQVIHSAEVQIVYNGIDNSPIASEYVPVHLSKQYSRLTNAVVSYYENEEELHKIFDKYNFKGNKDLKEDEAIIFKPHFYPHDGNGLIISNGIEEDIEYQEYIDKGLEIDDEIEIVYGQDSSLEDAIVFEEPFHIVGTLTMNKMNQEDKRIFDRQSPYSYIVIVNKETYQKYFPQDREQILLFHVENNQNLGKFKQNILSLTKQYSLNYEDILSMRQIDKTIITELFLKGLIFSGLVFVGITTLIYMQRKIYMLSIRHEISLNRAIGMTKRQVLGVYSLYSLWMYGLAFVGFICGFIFTNYSGIAHYDWYEEFFTIAFGYDNIILYVLLGILFLVIVLLSVMSVLKENILKHIQQN